MQKCLFCIPTYQPNVNISILKSLITCLGYQYQSLSTLKKSGSVLLPKKLRKMDVCKKKTLVVTYMFQELLDRINFKNSKMALYIVLHYYRDQFEYQNQIPLFNYLEMRYFQTYRALTTIPSSFRRRNYSIKAFIATIIKY